MKEFNNKDIIISVIIILVLIYLSYKNEENLDSSIQDDISKNTTDYLSLPSDITDVSGNISNSDVTYNEQIQKLAVCTANYNILDANYNNIIKENKKLQTNYNQELNNNKKLQTDFNQQLNDNKKYLNLNENLQDYIGAWKNKNHILHTKNLDLTKKNKNEVLIIIILAVLTGLFLIFMIFSLVSLTKNRKYNNSNSNSNVASTSF